MRKLHLFQNVLVLIACGVSVHLWRELSAEKKLTEQLREHGSVVDARAADGLKVSPAVIDSRSVVSAGEGGAESGEALSERGALADMTARLDSPAQLKDPEYRKSRLATIRMFLPKQYPGLIEELQLTAEEAGRLFDLFADQELEMKTAFPAQAARLGLQPDQEMDERLARDRAEMRRRHDEAVAAMLGYSRSMKLQDYQQHQKSYVDVSQLGEAFEGTGLPPLSASVKNALRTVYASERGSRTQDVSERLRAAYESRETNPNRFMEDTLKQEAEKNRRLLAAASSANLDPQSLEALHKILDRRLEVTRIGSLQKIQ